MNRAYQHQHGRSARILFVFLVLATCFRVWVGPFPLTPQARGQLPDSALQRKHILEEARRTNQILGEIKQILQSQTLNVRVVGADKKAIPPTRRRGD